MKQSCGLRVIVNGYPKSGNTWITRLVADVIGCPVGGFWGAPNHKELAIEGLERDSPHRVYKGHHRADQFDELDSNTKIIYLLRDPRDVACSGANYFSLKKFRDNNPNLSHYDKYQAMVDVMLKGGAYSWCQWSWGEHVEGFFNIYPEVLIVKYENFLKDTVSEISKVLNYLDLERSRDQIVSSVKNQSINRIKAIEDKKAKGRGSFFRKGKEGSYKEELNKNLVSDINNSFWYLMIKLGYLNDDSFEASVKDILLGG